ncbi:MAG TPA: Zn-ribbon domain-containing OB-fold protein [candidate division Zixibacteria bacterium]|nr:Zn-ribbon domain-containing OB-fold protein [candidate division Zixibacteria bacterium]
MADENRAIKKPLPEMTPVNRPFWEGARAGRLVMQKCRDCGSWVFCPRPLCVECHSERLEWVPLSGRGKVFSFTVIREVVGRALRGFAPDIPYVTAWIDLEEGPRFCSNIVGCPIDKVTIGMGVEVVFEDTGEGVVLPKFRPGQAAA